MSTDPRELAAGPYRTPGPLASRVAIYEFQRPRVDLVGLAVAALEEVPEGGVVVDAGCGPGNYLRRLRADLRGVGVDVSVGMLRAVPPPARRVAASADALPLRSGTADAALAMHMLYHLRTPADGLRELRRVLRPGGWLVLSTNDDSADGLWRIFREAGLDLPPVTAHWPLAGARPALQAAGFPDVEEQVFDYELELPSPEPALAYLDSCRTRFPHLPDSAWQAIRARVATSDLRTSGRVGLLTAR